MGWLIFAALLAGLVRGFSGFGTAMVFLPIASLYLTPFEAIASLAIMEFFGTFAVMRKSWSDADKVDLARLVVGMTIVTPFALLLLAKVGADFYRYSVSILSLSLLVLIGLGVRYKGKLNPFVIFSVGGLGGLTGGLTGIPGPPVILLYVASSHPISVIRANNLLFLYFFDVCVVLIFALSGVLTLKIFLLGSILAIPNFFGNFIGAKLFDPGKTNQYRMFAYIIIAVAAISGLPVWD
jgi:uncharacterized membrane protein YfcA